MLFLSRRTESPRHSQHAEGLWENVTGNRDQRKYVDNDENMTDCARSSAVMLDSEISKYQSAINSQRVAQGCTLSHHLFKICIHDLIVLRGTIVTTTKYC